MKKITLLLFLIVTGWQTFAQSTCNQTFQVLGRDDDPTVLTINAADVTCQGAGTVSSMKLTNIFGAMATMFCSTDGTGWYGFDLSIDGAPAIPVCGTDLNNRDITGFSTLTITSHDDDAWSDMISIQLDVEVTFTPTTPPLCTALDFPVNGAVNVLTTNMTWPVAAGGVDGYKLKVGTTPGGSDIVNMLDLGNVLTYDLLTTTPGTTYYVTVIAYNSLGDSASCTESSFTTCGANTVPYLENFDSSFFPENCWQEGTEGSLVSGPINITNSYWSVRNFANNGTNPSIFIDMYSQDLNHWAISPLFQIPSTGSYELKFDAAVTEYAQAAPSSQPWETDDYVEVLVSNGLDNWTVLYTYNDSNVPSYTGTTNLIDLSSYNGQDVRFAFRAIQGTSNGAMDIQFFIDNFQVRATPACLEPTSLVTSNVTTSSADVSWASTSGNYEYVLDQVATDPAGAGLSYTSTNISLSSLSPGTTYYFHVRTDCGSGLFSTWSTVSFRTEALPPVNDECINAIDIAVDSNYCDGVNTNGSNEAATDSGVATAACFTGPDKDVWFSFTVPANTATVDLTTEFTGGTLEDTQMALYSGLCGALTEVACNQDGGNVVLGNGNAWNSTISDFAVNVGETYYVRISGYSPFSDLGTFCLAINTNQVLSNENFNANAFKAYPNPVKNILNLSYTSEISSVEVYNMLGQNVMTKTLNVTQGQIDMSNLSAGSYVVKVTADGVTKSIKVIKQ